MNTRVKPMSAKRIKIVSYWSGIGQLNGRGEAEFDFDIPQFSGQVRLMAVAYKNESFGSKEAEMTVADPIVLSSALPRFMSPGETVTMPVTISNTTGNSTSAAVRLKLGGSLRTLADDQQNVSVGANSEGATLFQLIAPASLGLGKVTVEINDLIEHFTDETEIGIRPSAPLQKATGSGPVMGGSNQPIDWNTTDFIPSSV